MAKSISPLHTPRSPGNDTAKETQRNQKDIENGKNNIHTLDQVNGLMSSLQDILSSRLTGTKGSETEFSKLKEFTADFVKKTKVEEKK
jgi:CheY-like chemotaxis protein